MQNVPISKYPPFSLLKFEPQIQITTKLESYFKNKQSERLLNTKPSIQDILNLMFPPRQWKTPQNRYFMQYVSHKSPERQDIDKLRKGLNDVLLMKQAKIDVICPIRQQIFAQLLDQIIRQVSINSPERGMLLLRLRDQRKMNLAVQQTVFQQSVLFGKKKQIESQEGIDQLESTLNFYEQKKKKLQQKLDNLSSKKQTMQNKIRQRKAIQIDKRQYQYKAITQQTNNLAQFMQKYRKIQQQMQQNLDQQLKEIQQNQEA